MTLKPWMLLFLIICVALIVVLGSRFIGRRLLFYQTHNPHANSLTPWLKNGEVIGYSRIAESPRNVWLMLHGNGGQASDRLYAIPNFSNEDSVFILEYPGYGNREGISSKESFNNATEEAYNFLRTTYANVPVCVASESIGSGPAAYLSSLSHPPDKFVLIVPFDKLSLVAENHFPSFLVQLLLKDDWDNVEAFSRYKGPVDIFGAEADTIIPARHAKALADAIPQARLTIISGGHNDWADDGKVKIRYP
jgi:uncharacterized protein